MADVGTIAFAAVITSFAFAIVADGSAAAKRNECSIASPGRWCAWRPRTLTSGQSLMGTHRGPRIPPHAQGEASPTEPSIRGALDSSVGS